MRVIRFLLVVLSLCAIQSAGAQRAQPIGATSHSVAAVKLHTATSAALPGNSGMPRWVRWGLVGAIGGAVLFVVADSNHSVGSRVLSGAATGFVVVGGGVLLYDAVCGGSGPSAFCGR